VFIHIGPKWIDVASLEYTYDIRPEEAGAGAILRYRGVPGFVCFRQLDGQFVLVNSRRVYAFEGNGDGESTQIETYLNADIHVFGAPTWVADLMNRARSLSDG
jgi:hypothetical protein